ncbi:MULTISPECIES: hypothetical protein [unclassified Streptomyces]|nr:MULTISPECIES: hypothetical protein [unclassified Streptomyces]MDF3146442.1 hypothetical protein [Streptomyces sp. T21Q-yed]WDF42112.1 hypothetical protein PBV52_37600 [Streptomyces sp. T12]
MIRGRAFAADLPNWREITAQREYLDRAQSRAENPWLKVQAKRRGDG